MVEQMRGNESLHHSPVGGAGNRPHRDGGLVIGDAGRIKKGGGVNCAERVGQPLGVAGGRGRGLELAAHVEYEAPGYGITAGAGVVVEAVFVGPAIVVNDGRAKMIAVVQGRSANCPGHAVD